MKDVTAAIIIENERVLIAKRAPGEKHAGMWELPGGKVEPGETPENCLVREIWEELEMRIEVGEFFHESIYEYGYEKIRLLAYRCKWTSGNMKLNVHSKIEWLKIKDIDIDAYDFAPADISILRKLRNG